MPRITWLCTIAFLSVIGCFAIAEAVRYIDRKRAHQCLINQAAALKGVHSFMGASGRGYGNPLNKKEVFEYFGRDFFTCPSGGSITWSPWFVSNTPIVSCSEPGHHHSDTYGRQIDFDPEVFKIFQVSASSNNPHDSHPPHYKDMAGEELELFTQILRTAKFKRHVNHTDASGWNGFKNNPSRPFKFDGYKKNHTSTGRGEVSFDGKTIYWSYAIFSLTDSEADKIVELMLNPITIESFTEEWTDIDQK